MPRRGGGCEEKLSGKDFGKRLREIRIEKKMSAKLLAQMVGVQESYINQMEIGNRTPSFDTLIKLVNSLEVSADELLGDYILKSVPYLVESRIGKMVAQMPKDQQNWIESHIKLDIELMGNKDFDNF